MKNHVWKSHVNKVLNEGLPGNSPTGNETHLVMEYLCHKWPRICSTCRKHFPVLSSFMTYHRVC